jgi:hypothetical protein
MRNAHRPATLEPVRFGEFLRDRNLITDEQWLAALAEHWSCATNGARRKRIGVHIVNAGYLPAEVVEAEARTFHDGIDIVEVDEMLPRSERTTIPQPMVSFSERRV